MQSIFKLIRNLKIKALLFTCFFAMMFNFSAYAITKSNYERFIEEGYLGISGADLTFNAKGQMYRKFGHFIIDGLYTGGDAQNPFYNEENSRDLAVEAANGDSTYDVYAEVEDDEIDYSYEDDEELNASEYDRAAFQAKLDAMYYGNTYHAALGYGKYNLRPGKNLTAFIKFAYDFYKNVSGDPKVGCKNEFDLITKGITDGKICPMEKLETYASKSYSSAECVDGAFKDIWKDCTKHWEYEGSTLDTTDNIFEHLQDIFMAYVYLKPGVKKIERFAPNFKYDDLDESDYAAILSMMYERFGGRPINPSKVESSDAISVIGTGDVLGALIDFPEMSIADRIYTYMIEVKYKNSDLKLASWLKEYEDVMGGEYQILDAETYDRFMKAYQEAFKKYGQDTANDTLLDYGCVLTPDIFESKISYEKALSDFANTIKSHFGGSSFYNNRNNANFVAKSYAMAKKMCENSAFSDITDIYACDMDVIEHSIGYDSTCILLADTQVVELQDVLTPGSSTDTDSDGLSDYKEAGAVEEVDISNFIKEYCKYNKYTTEETNEMLAKNSKVTMYNYTSNPVLPDSDFDGRTDNKDSKKLDNTYKSKVDTDNYNNVNIDFCQDYRYFFMDPRGYYEDLAEMGLILSNMVSKKDGRDKSFTNKGEGFTAHGISEYMWYIGMDQVESHLIKDVYTNEPVDVPYVIGQHDAIALMGKVNNLERNIITCVIGENENYKDFLAANFDGALGADGSVEENYHHVGYDIEAEKIYEKLMDYSNRQTDDWKKSYWIVGYGTGGSIANLVAKKMIDNKGNREDVYCYTYQAPNTINRDLLSKRIYNVKYQSIFNIVNEDDYVMLLENEKMNMTKYGVIKKYSLGDSSSAIARWNKNKGILKTYTGSYGKSKRTVNGIINAYKDADVVVGFSFSELVISLKNVLMTIRSYLAPAELIEDIQDSVSQEERELGKNVQKDQRMEYNQTSVVVAIDAGYDATKVTDPQNAINTYDSTNLKVSEALEILATWYVDNVYTYWAGNKYSGTTWVTKFYENIDTKKSRAKNTGNVALERRLEKIQLFNENKEETDTLYFKDDNENEKHRTNYNDKFIKNGAEVYTWIDSYGSQGRYYSNALNTQVGSTFNEFGDDCSSFTMAVLDYATKGKLKAKLDVKEDASMYDAGGGNISQNKNYSGILQELGFQIIDITKEMTLDSLEDGDVLISLSPDQHYEFVIIGEDGSGNVGTRKRSFKQFGWGSPKGVYPNNNFNIYKSVNENKFKENFAEGHEYTKIIRLTK